MREETKSENELGSGNPSISAKTGRHFRLIVFNIEKSANVAMLMRSAYAMGCCEALVVGRKTFKVTGATGAYQFLPWRHFYRLEEAVTVCRAAGDRIYGVEIGGRSLTETRFDRDAAFILGNEGKGLAEAQRFCDEIVTIPQWGGVPSLNVAAAAAIVMYEFQKQQGLAPAEVCGQAYFDANYPATRAR